MGKGDNQKAKDSTKGSVKRRNVEKVEKELLFSKTNYIIIGVGLAMVIVGFFLMSGGHNQPDEWDATEIYSFMRITISPLVILSGLGVVVFAIFKSSDEEVQNLEA